MIPPILQNTQVAPTIESLLNDLHELNLKPDQYNKLAFLLVQILTELQLKYQSMSTMINGTLTATSMVLAETENKTIRDTMIAFCAGINAYSVEKKLPAGLSMIEFIGYHSTYLKRHHKIISEEQNVQNIVEDFLNNEYPPLTPAPTEFSNN